MNELQAFISTTAPGIRLVNVIVAVLMTYQERFGWAAINAALAANLYYNVIN